MSRHTNAWRATPSVRKRTLRTRWGPLALSACLLAATAASAAAAGEPQGKGGSPPAASEQGPLVLERTTRGPAGGVIAAPELKITNIDHDIESFLGAYVGWRFGNGFLVGGGIYGELDWFDGHYHDGHWYYEADTGDHRHMTYAGVVVGWSMPGNHPVRLGLRALVGGGWARRDDYWYDPWGKPGHPYDRDDDYYYYSNDWEHFFVFEPQLDLSIRLSRHLSLALSGGYRGVADSEGVRPDVGGAVGSLSLQVGRF